jgi:hypothetical protein
MFSQDLQVAGGARIASGSNVSLATAQVLVPQGSVTGGNLSIASQGGGNLLYSFNAFNVQSGEVALFAGGNISGTVIPLGVTLVPDSLQGVIVTPALVPAPLPGAVALYATGLIACYGLCRRSMKSRPLIR